MNIHLSVIDGRKTTPPNVLGDVWLVSIGVAMPALDQVNAIFGESA
jgi:hypothetical protein